LLGCTYRRHRLAGNIFPRTTTYPVFRFARYPLDTTRVKRRCAAITAGKYPTRSCDPPVIKF
jgi:hypothetical protein